MAKSDLILEKLDNQIEAIAKLDERSQSIMRELHSQGEHLTRINSRLDRNESSITTINTTVYGKDSDKGLVGKVEKNARDIFKLLIIVALCAGAAGGGVAKLIQLFSG